MPEEVNVFAMKANEIDIQHEFERLQEALDAFEALRTGAPEALVRRAADVSGWSVAQHLYHIALATDLAFRHVKSLVAQKGRLIQEEGEIGERAGAVLRSDTTPRGEAKAPRMVTPDEEVNPEYLEMELRGNGDALESLRSIADDIANAPGWIPHQILGPLAAPHWLRFAALHARHHWSIMRDIEEAAGQQP